MKVEKKKVSNEQDEHRPIMDNKDEKKKCHAKHEVFMACPKHPWNSNCGNCADLR